MAGTLTISTLSDGTNSTSSTNCIQGSAKAWVNYNSNSQTIRASYNVSSVTYNGTGDFTVNFTNAFPNANYAVAGIYSWTNGVSASGGLSIYTNAGTPTTTNCRLNAIGQNATVYNRDYNMAIFLG